MPGADRRPAGRTDSGFSAADRSMGDEDRIILTTVGVDIGSATCHVMFSRVELERHGTNYVLERSEILHESPITLTPYASGNQIDEAALRSHFRQQYDAAGLEPGAVDTGAVILTGVALLRHNARAIGDIFAEEAGRFVAVGAGDNLEGILAAHGSGAIGLSKVVGTVLNIDIGGGTTKIARCRDGEIESLVAMDIGARLVAYDDEGRIVRLEDAAVALSDRLGLDLALGGMFDDEVGARLASYLVSELIGETSAGGATSGSVLLRGPGLPDRSRLDAVTFSGGVSEFVYERAETGFGDLGHFLGRELRTRAAEFGVPVHDLGGGIRATVIGASQYSIQVSGSTIYISDPALVPLRNIPVVAPAFAWGDGLSDVAPEQVATAVETALQRLDLGSAEQPVALAVGWRGSATFTRLDALCTGIVAGLHDHLAAGHPLILVCGHDIGGLVGLHLVEEMELDAPVISIDAVDLHELDYIDIGTFVPGSGAVPVLVKSLLFPTTSSPQLHTTS